MLSIYIVHYRNFSAISKFMRFYENSTSPYEAYIIKYTESHVTLHSVCTRVYAVRHSPFPLFTVAITVIIILKNTKLITKLLFFTIKFC